MSEEAKEVKKKGGKLPMIIALVAILGGGGFFMMKKNGGEKKEPEIKLGKDVEPLNEILVNLKGGDTYVRTEIFMHLAEGAKKEEVAHSLPALRDAAISVLGSVSLPEVSSVEGRQHLKWLLAEYMNSVLTAHNEEKKKEKKKKGKDAQEEEEPAHVLPSLRDAVEPDDPHLDSDEGPILKIYFNSWATQ